MAGNMCEQTGSVMEWGCFSSCIEVRACLPGTVSAAFPACAQRICHLNMHYGPAMGPPAHSQAGSAKRGTFGTLLRGGLDRRQLLGQRLVHPVLVSPHHRQLHRTAHGVRQTLDRHIERQPACPVDRQQQVLRLQPSVVGGRAVVHACHDERAR
eukprot:354230-Chlamydomonas_euryale.AAC.8